MPTLLKATRKTAKETKPVVDSLFDNEEEEVKEEASKQKAPAKTKAVKKSFEQTDRIKCRSVTQGGLYVEGSKTKQPYAFSCYGDETEIEYRDLVALVQVKSSYLFHPYFVVEDPDFVAEFPQLDKFYTEYYDVQDLEGILDLPVDQMLEKLKRLPTGATENLKVIAASQVADGRMDSVKKIKELNAFFGIDLNLVAELNND